MSDIDPIAQSAAEDEADEAATAPDGPQDDDTAAPEVPEDEAADDGDGEASA